MTTVFFSYCHKDEPLRDELEVHLAPLKRQGIIDAWHDRRIDAGDNLAGSISEHLERADIVLLLISPYFLHSDYCFDVEMRRALERHAAGDARVIPVILDPCDWHSAPFGKLLAVPKDGRPITKFPNRHDALLEIAQAVRKAAESMKGNGRSIQTKSIPAALLPAAVRPDVRSSNLRVKKSFTDHERDAFLDDSFEYIAKFFEGSLDELQKRNPDITGRFKRIDANRFTAFIYRDGKSASECAVRLGGFLGPGISYSCQASSTNSFNESLSVLDDGHSLFLKPTMALAIAPEGAKQQLSRQGAAEMFWAILVRPLQQ
jgi:hypothetical protein